MGLRHFSISRNFSLIIGLHLGRHLGYIEMLNDAKVASLGSYKDNICTTRINKENKFKIRFQFFLKFVQILLDYKFLLHQGLSEPDFYGDLVYKLKKIVGSNNCSAQFIK